MTIWIVFAVLTALVALSILVPIARASKGSARDSAHDAEVYRAQLDEVERDLERGLIDEEAAEAARTEIARRLIATAKPEAPAQQHRGRGFFAVRAAQVAAIVFLPLAAIGVYVNLGAPDVPDQPLAERLAASPGRQDLPLLVARVEKHLADNPQDGQGWEVLAPVYMRMGRLEDAASAYRNAIRILGPTAEREANLGEALTMANQGLVSADARAAFERAANIAPGAVKPRFFLALALGQEGKNAEAAKAWRSLLDEAQGGEPWVPAALAELEKAGGEPPERFAAQSGPSAGDVAAASSMTEAERAEMIEGMVASLEQRLRAEGGSTEEWMRLMRAYAVLGRKDKVAETYELAAASFADDPASMEELEAAKEALNIEPDQAVDEPATAQ